MSRVRRKLSEWFFQIENEVMVPFLLVGIVVICGFGAISYYTGYTMQKDNQKAVAVSWFTAINQDLNFLYDKLPESALEEKYRDCACGSVRITDQNGREITAAQNQSLHKDRVVLLTSEGENKLGWKLEYLVDRDAFREDLLEKLNYVVVGAIAALLIIIQASIFIAHSIAQPICGMSSTCRDINNNKRNYRSYRFDSVRRRDEIGQLAATFEVLLRDMDNYTKMEYTSRMSATLAHEIKNPIAGIRSGIQLLQGRAAKEGEKLLCASMIKEIDRVTSLIMNLFTLSVKKDSWKDEVSLETVIGEIALIYAKGPKEQRITVEAEVEKGLTGYLNEDELRQIIHNLLNNSMRAIPADREGRIQITGEGRDHYAVITLSDNGKGMTPEELAQAVEPFYTRSINGLGLGLSIVNKLVEQNQGVMRIESAAGEGTKVILTFYRREEDYGESFNRG